PAVVELIVTDCAEVKLPPAGLKTGAVTCCIGVMAKTAGGIELSVMPPAYAIAFRVAEVATEMAPEYKMPAVSEGLDPSVVYRIEAPAVVELIVTDCAEVKLPPAGLKIGAATCCIGVMVKTAVVIELSVMPPAYAIAFRVAEVATEMAPEYKMPAVSEGLDPSVVYRIEAPAVVELIVTDCAEVKLPPAGLKTGAATCCIGVMVKTAEVMTLSVMPPAYAIAFRVAEVATEMAPEYKMPAVSEGLDPSVVYRIEAPAVVELIVTDCGGVELPPAGLKIGGAACCIGVMVKTAVVIGLSVMPPAYAIAFRVAEVATEMAPEYKMPAVSE